MPEAADSFDPEALLHDAISSVALSAFGRDVNLSGHVDGRLPGRLKGGAASLMRFLREGLAQSVAEYVGGHVAVALWESGPAEPWGGGLLIEISASGPASRPPGRVLSTIWRTACENLGFEARPAPGQMEGERLLVRAAARAVPGSGTVAGRWQGVLGGRAIVERRPILFDRERYRRSLEAAGITLSLSASDEEALQELARRSSEASPAILVLDGHAAFGAAIDLARRARADAACRHCRIILCGVTRRVSLSPEEAELFDAVMHVAPPWRRLSDVLQEFSPRAATGSGVLPERVSAKIPTLAGRRVLVAEDVATNRVLLRALLEAAGARVEAVESGTDVVRRHAAEPADLIVLDLQMPGMGGIAAVRRIRELSGEPARVPVIAVTAHAREEDRQRALRAGMDAYLAKPLVVSDFYTLVARLLDKEGPDRS